MPEKISEEINDNRRRFLSTAAMTIAAAQFGMIGSANAQSSKANTICPQSSRERTRRLPH